VLLVRIVVVLALGPLVGLAAQTDRALPRAEDVSTLDGMVKAYYDVVSGPAGSLPDPARDQSLHHPNAQVALLDRKADGTATVTAGTLADYYRLSGTGPRPSTSTKSIESLSASERWSTSGARTNRAGSRAASRSAEASIAFSFFGTDRAGGSWAGCSTTSGTATGSRRNTYPGGRTPTLRGSDHGDPILRYVGRRQPPNLPHDGIGVGSYIRILAADFADDDQSRIRELANNRVVLIGTELRAPRPWSSTMRP
jgi:hypothetical protein